MTAEPARPEHTAYFVLTTTNPADPFGPLARRLDTTRRGKARALARRASTQHPNAMLFAVGFDGIARPVAFRADERLGDRPD